MIVLIYNIYSKAISTLKSTINTLNMIIISGFIKMKIMYFFLIQENVSTH